MKRVVQRIESRKSGFTLIELLVVISIIMLLAAMALPVLMRAAGQARAVNCVANLRQIGTAMRTYATAHNGLLPGSQGSCKPDNQPTWIYHKDPDHDPNCMQVFPKAPMEGQLYPYYRDPKLVLCPADRDGNGKFSYSMAQNCAFRVMDMVENSTASLLVIEEHPKYHIAGIVEGVLVENGGLQRREDGFGCTDRPAVRHRGKAGHVSFDGSTTLTEFPLGITASEFEIKPWGYSCGWPEVSQ